MSDKSDKSKKKQLAETKRMKSSQMFGMRGLSVRDVVLPWESKEEFKQLHRELTEELSPQGRMEEDIVFDVARLHWHKYRLLKMLRTAALKDTFFIELMDSGRKSWPGIRKYLREQDQDFRTIRGNLSNLFSKLAEAVRLGRSVNGACRRVKSSYVRKRQQGQSLKRRPLSIRFG